MSAEQSFINRVVNEIRSRYIGIDTIFDIGAHDLEESIALAKEYPDAKITAFEANPEMWDICKSKETNQITLMQCGVSDYTGSMDFNITTTPKQCSMFEPITSEVKEVVSIPVMRLDDLADTPDLIFMDIQGGEYRALIGLGDNLNRVKVIATELFVTGGEYKDAHGIDEVDALIKDRFELIVGNPLEGSFDNFIYVRKDLL
jgi:FkbM family methyltransferase